MCRRNHSDNFVWAGEKKVCTDYGSAVQEAPKPRMDLRRGYDASRRYLLLTRGNSKGSPRFSRVRGLQSPPSSSPFPNPNLASLHPGAQLALPPHRTTPPVAGAPISRRSSAMASTRDLAIASLSAATGAVVAAAALRLLSSRRTSSVRPQNVPAAANGSASERPLAQSPFDPVKREGFVNVLPPSLAILMPVRSS